MLLNGIAYDDNGDPYWIADDAINADLTQSETEDIASNARWEADQIAQANAEAERQAAIRAAYAADQIAQENSNSAAAAQLAKEQNTPKVVTTTPPDTKGALPPGYFPNQSYIDAAGKIWKYVGTQGNPFSSTPGTTYQRVAVSPQSLIVPRAKPGGVSIAGFPPMGLLFAGVAAVLFLSKGK